MPGDDCICMHSDVTSECTSLATGNKADNIIHLSDPTVASKVKEERGIWQNILQGAYRVTLTVKPGRGYVIAVMAYAGCFC